jgi:hypothetical protein
MYTTIIFLLLCVVEFVFCWIQWDQIESYRNLGQDVAIATGVEKHRRYTAFVRIAAKIISVGKVVLLALIPVILLINFIIAVILGTILSFIF